ncbi:MAG: hypothetical protein OQL09_04985, partial [Gammaproteobacteria bacterium]|nr:hypothetical protein [Gammaproteobacteria bacterium]
LIQASLSHPFPRRATTRSQGKELNMRIISLLLSLLIFGYLLMTYLNPAKTNATQTTSRPKETIDRAQQQVNQAMDDYQKKLNNHTARDK